MARPAVNEGWEARLKTLLDFADIEVHVEIHGDPDLREGEWARLGPKLRMVEEFATHLAENMLKGTIKYVTDNYDIATWMAEEEDDTVDSVNYRLLRRQAMVETGWIS